MTDKIKNFIQQHREAFDSNVPGAHVWNSMQHTLGRLQSADALERSILIQRMQIDSATPPASAWENIRAELDALEGSDDPLEHFILANRNALDTAVPDTAIWQNIEQSIHPASSRPKVVHMTWQRHLLRIAASLTLLIAGVGMGIWYARASQNGMDMADVSSEYKELEQFYERDIATKQQKLATFTGNRPAEVNLDLQQLDHIMQDLRKELAEVPPANREQVVRAMIENYKAKTAILEKVLRSLDSTQKPVKDNSDAAGYEIKDL
ncbi:MAG: hypothetical protein JNM22_09740 [Saprospiraceae bacterium]|nr:hypothetical protein [Saprospiraceae bacterium]